MIPLFFLRNIKILPNMQKKNWADFGQLDDFSSVLVFSKQDM